MSRRSIGFGVLVGLVWVSGCALQHEESPSPAQSMDAAVEPVESVDDRNELRAEEQAAPPTVAELERALATNNAKLRELGVALPGTPGAAPPHEPSSVTREGPESAKSESKRKPDSKPTSKSNSAGVKGGAASDSVGQGPGQGNVGGKASPPPAKDKDKDGVERPRPEPAKSTPAAPSTGQLDAGKRCEQICDLAEISCGLGDQICELADRHTQQPEYLSACERAAGDCDAAKEACDACAE